MSDVRVVDVDFVLRAERYDVPDSGVTLRLARRTPPV